MGQILLQKDFSPADFRSVPGTVTGSLKLPLAAVDGTSQKLFYAIPLGAGVNVSFQIQARRISEELAATARLIIGLFLRTGSINTSYQFTAQCMAVGADDTSETLGTLVTGGAANTPGSVYQRIYHEIEIETDDYRNYLTDGDQLDIVLTLVWNAARAGNANDLLIEAADMRLQLPEPP